MLAVIAVLALVAVGVVFLTGDGDDVAAITLEPIDHVQENDFFGNLDLGLGSDVAEDAVVQIGDSVAGLPEFDGLVDEISSSLSGSEASGTEPGLYGGSREDGVCNLEDLASFLTDDANADKAEAWAEVQGVAMDEIEDFLERLTPVRLRMDTRVTNHGFEDGEAVPFQSVLQAGTAVLVDDTGVPRVKCNCGNPLDAPEPLEGEGDESALDVQSVADNPEAAWEGFDPGATVTVVEASEPVEDHTLVDLESGDLLERPVGTQGDSDRGTGDLQITLEWFGSADLDLHVFDPSGAEIYYANPSPTGTDGQLDLDANAGCGDVEADVAENVFWPEGGAPSGAYEVEVHGWSVGGEGCVGGDYTLTISVFGQDDEVHTGSVGDNESDFYPVTVP